MAGNLVLSDALRRSREAIVFPDADGHYPLADHYPAVPYPSAVDDRDKAILTRLRRWDPWVLSYIILPDLLRKMEFDMGPAPGLAGPAHAVLRLAGEPAFRMDRPDKTVFTGQIIAAMDAAQLREDRSAEILTQAASCVPFWAAILPLSQARTPAIMAVLAVAYELALYIELRFKHCLACWRPDELSPQIQPMIATPGHGSYPMGHACEAVVFATVLAELTRKSAKPQWQALAAQLWALALRIGDNRIVAGVHFPVDQVAGMALGQWIGRYLAQVGQGVAKWTGKSLTFATPHSVDATVSDPDQLVQLSRTIATQGAAIEPVLPVSLEFQVLWRLARDELSEVDA